MSVTALIVAAGRGTRAGGALPKQWQHIAGKSVLAHTVAAFVTHPRVDEVVVVLHADDIKRHSKELDGADLRIATGGADRSTSVQNGLAMVSDGHKVLIHDGARCCVPAAVIDGVLDALMSCAAAAPGLAVTDALWRAEGQNISGIQDRSGLFGAQTPQGFDVAAIRAAYTAYDGPAADDVAVARAAGLPVTMTQGSADNIKITTPEDFARAARTLEKKMDIRTGNGFDVHAFGPGDHVVLCGVKIPHNQGLVGHSDADVGMHTVTDAIYGGLARGDIGQHFPPSDDQWKGAASDIFLRHAVALATQMGFTLTHVDCTLICENPKIGPHAQAMRRVMADIMSMEIDRVSVKATTSERLGFTGRGEGIACMATATLVKL
jgi:2-C-methyl-D-erythritol 4-phosphate cytidylyltransferase/2-C-methyl-D-erythritol 2,4-cyclodiphosphate synthase